MKLILKKMLCMVGAAAFTMVSSSAAEPLVATITAIGPQSSPSVSYTVSNVSTSPVLVDEDVLLRPTCSIYSVDENQQVSVSSRFRTILSNVESTTITLAPQESKNLSVALDTTDRDDAYASPNTKIRLVFRDLIVVPVPGKPVTIRSDVFDVPTQNGNAQ